MNRLAARFLPYALAFSGNLCLMVLELVAARLVARHVGASLVVWTSVIGIMLGGICLGSVLGGRLADRADPGRVVGPLYGLAAAVTLGCLWANAAIGLVPGVAALPWNVGTVLVVTLDFLAPATVLGMIGPVVAKMAVARSDSRRSGSALGDVSSWGAIGSIAGTFLAGFVLIYEAPTSTIVTVVAAALALLAAAMLNDRAGRALGMLAVVTLGVGAAATILNIAPRGFFAVLLHLGPVRLTPPALAGHVAALALAVVSALRLRAEVARKEVVPEPEAPWERVKFADLAALAFVSSLAFMALEMVAGRLVTRHLGSSVFGWTSVIGVLLGGLGLGNLLGGKIADGVKREGEVGHLFLIASVLTLWVLVSESPPRWLITNPIAAARGAEPVGLTGGGPLLEMALGMHDWSWPLRVLTVVAASFLPPALAMGMIGPVLAKLAVARVGWGRRTGRAIGQVYAWGMVGSLLGTFLTGFVLIDLIGTKGVTLALATTLALAATLLGTAWHGAWAGLPLGLCLVAFVPLGFLRAQAVAWGLRDERGDPTLETPGVAYLDESNYYMIKVSNPPPDPRIGYSPPPGMRTLVLDSLIHGHYQLGHPEVLEYDYEFLYSQATRRFAQARLRAAGSEDAWKPLRTMFIGGGSYTFPRYLQAIYPGTAADVAEIDPDVTEANHLALGLPRDTPIRTTWGDARRFVDRRVGKTSYDLIFGDAFNDFSVPWHLTTREFNDKVSALLAPDGVYMINIIDLYLSDAQAEEQGKTTAEARKTGAFLGAWLHTARKTFPHLYVFGTQRAPGLGIRETFVVVASKAPLDLVGLGRRDGDPRFFIGKTPFLRDPYDESDLGELELRSRGIELTDDYAPVEDLLAPVASTRAEKE